MCICVWSTRKRRRKPWNSQWIGLFSAQLQLQLVHPLKHVSYYYLVQIIQNLFLIFFCFEREKNKIFPFRFGYFGYINDILMALRLVSFIFFCFCYDMPLQMYLLDSDRIYVNHVDIYIYWKLLTMTTSNSLNVFPVLFLSRRIKKKEGPIFNKEKFKNSNIY